MTFTNNLLPTLAQSFPNVCPDVTGLYKCEITYLAPASISCPVVVPISRLVLVSPPSSLHLYHGLTTEVTNSSLGPVTEDAPVSLRCVARGGRPPPDLYWYLGDKRLEAETAVRSAEDRLTGGGEVTASVTLPASRDLLQVSVTCKAANQAMEDTAMTASVTLDINLRPLSTRSSGIQ